MLHDSVVQRWGADIVAGAIPVGSRIGADEAAARLGVSRTVVREAVRVLESMGLLTVRRRVGITVSPVDRWNHLDPNVSRWQLTGPRAQDHLRALGELRRVNEPLAARLAAQHPTDAVSGSLTAAVVAMSIAARSGDAAGLVAWDAEFHSTLLNAAGNPLLAALAPLVNDAITHPAADHGGHGCGGPATIAAHGTIAAAIRTGDPAAAELAAQALLVGPRPTGTDTLDRQPPHSAARAA
jgi:DNA-binding FadR family transcriptional regulator